MNTFTKLVISILFLGVTRQVFPQEMMYKSYPKVDIPFYDGNAVRSFLKRQTAFDTLWLPVSVTETYTDQYDNIFPMGNHIYEYDENGLLKKDSFYRLSDGYLMSAFFYNNAYIDPLMDIPDTMFYNSYIDGEGINHPARRYYYNNRQADASYWEEYYQVWDGNQWNTEERSYVHLLDTATVSEFQDHIEVFDRDGNIKQSRKTLLTFDDQGNVIEAVSDCYSLYDGQYKLKYEYWYDSDGKCYNRNSFYAPSGSPWQLVTKFTDIKWFEFHGFDNGDLLFHGKPQGLYKGYSPKNKNKMSSLNFWELYVGSMTLTIVDTIEWKTYPPSSHFFRYMAYNMCLSSHRYYEYNKHYHLNCDISLNYEVWNCDTIMWMYVKQEYINRYDDSERRYEYTWINTGFDKEEDSIRQMKMTYTVDSFTYVVRPVGVDELPTDRHGLLIVPNPSDGTVRITAEDDIAAITLYASDGRLAYSRDGTGKEMIVNTEGLAAGVYIVQVRLRNGGVRTGKVIKN